MITRSFSNNFEVQDYTEELLLIPNTWGLINSLGIFGEEGVTTHSVVMESRNGTLAVIPDQYRGVKNQVSHDDTRTIRTWAVPHFPLSDALYPADLVAKRAYGNPDAQDTREAAIARKLGMIRQNHAITLEAARAYTLTTGQTYAPNGTVSANYYTDFGVTRVDVAFDLDVTTTDVGAKIETVIATIQDNILTGTMAYDVIGLCSPEFFAALISHPKIEDAYKWYNSTQEPLRNRLGGNQTAYRQFSHRGITFIEYRGFYSSGSPLIPTNEAYFFPKGTDMFKTYFSPANKFSLVGTSGESAYVFIYDDGRDSEITIETESNHLHLITRPKAVVRGTLT